MVNLRTTYLGLKLKNPIVPSASPLSHNVDSIRRLEDSHASAVVLYSLFEEQICYDSHLLNETLQRGTEAFAESLTYLPEMKDYNVGTGHYLQLINDAKQKVGIPIIASINGTSLGAWVDYAKKIQEAGADALELNLYRLPSDPSITTSEITAEYLEIVSEIRKTVSIPLAVKISPFISSIPHLAKEIAQIGAQGIVVFNRFYQADISTEKLEVMHKVNYSDSDDLLLPLRWTAILYGQVNIDIAITSGVHTSQDAIKAIMAGANVTMMASELLRNGVKRIPIILTEMEQWMGEHGHESVEEMRGNMSLQNVANPEKYERAQYLRVLDSLKPDSAKIISPPHAA